MKQDDEFIPTRASLLNRLKDWDDGGSWKEFFDTYWKLLYTVASKAGFGDAEAQDIVQDTIIAVAKQMPEFQYDPARGSFKSWLLRIVRRRIIDRFRKRQRTPAQVQEAATETAQTSFIQRLPDPTPERIDQIWEEEWQQQLLDAALERVKSQIGAKDFQIFDCHVLKQWPVPDVVAALRVSENQVYVAKSRVSALLKKEIQKLEERMR